MSLLVKMYRCFCVIVLMVFVVGCAFKRNPARLTSYPSSSHRVSSWQERQSRLMGVALAHWHARGSLLIHYNNQTNLGHFDWHEQNGCYNLQIRGPLSVGGVQIIGRPGHVTLQNGHSKNNRTLSASSPEKLLLTQLGWHIPITPLRFWILGLPAPKTPAHIQLDTFNRLVVLEQSGWRIHFSRFVQINGIALPQRLNLQAAAVASESSSSAPKVLIKLHISRWRF